MKRLLLLLSLSSPAWCMTPATFHRISEHWAKVFGLQDSGHPYTIQLVSAETLSKFMGGGSYFGASMFNDSDDLWIVYVLNDEGYAKMARDYNVVPLTQDAVDYSEEVTLIHELCHIWHIRDEDTCDKLAYIILDDGTPRPLPDKWAEQWQKPVLKPPQRVPQAILELFGGSLPPGVTIQRVPEDKDKEDGQDR